MRGCVEMAEAFQLVNVYCASDSIAAKQKAHLSLSLLLNLVRHQESNENLNS